MAVNMPIPVLAIGELRSLHRKTACAFRLSPWT